MTCGALAVPVEPTSSEDSIMPRLLPRNLTLVLPLALSVILAGLVAAPLSAAADDDAKPAKKDNPKARQAGRPR